jgi:hypothetical protein
MLLRRSTVELPFATLKYRIFGLPNFPLRGLDGSRTEMSLAVLTYNLRRMMNVLGLHHQLLGLSNMLLWLGKGGNAINLA